MNNKNLLKTVSEYVYGLFREKLPHEYVYHDYNHTLGVVDGCKEIGEGVKLAESEMEIVIIAAWFHDTGYIFSYADHEERSAEIAENFLKEHNYPQNKIDEIKSCILSTKLPLSSIWLREVSLNIVSMPRSGLLSLVLVRSSFSF